jgi:hypothetical protein
MIKLNRWLDRPEHRIIIFLGLWVIFSWLIAVPEVQLGRHMIEINSTSQIVNLSLIRNSTLVTRFVAQYLDKVPLITNIIYSISWHEVVFFTLLILFSFKDKNYLYLSYSAKTVIIVQISMHIYLLIQMFRINQVTNPITALNLINQVAIVYQVLGVLTLVLSFITFVFFTIKLGANSLHE